MTERIERQELYCHECGMYVQFPIDLSMNGNHVLECPNCKHEHCRVVKDGVITYDRWAQRNGPTFRIVRNVITATTLSSSANSPFTSVTWGTASTSGTIYYTVGS